MHPTLPRSGAGTLLALALFGTLALPGLSGAEGPQRPDQGYYSKPRVHFAFGDFDQIRLKGQDFVSHSKWDCADVESLLKAAGATHWERLFYEHSIEKLDEMRATGEARRGLKLPDLNNWFTVVLPSDAAAADLAARLAKNSHIRAAEVTKIPVAMAVDIAPTTPDYQSGQDYHDAAPYGMGIAAAWGETGGTGAGIQILHHEGGWITDHEDLNIVHTGGGNEYPSGDSGWYNHGTACVSILAAPSNGYGMTGLAHGVDQLKTRAFWNDGSPNTWIAATTYLNVGDVISASWGYGGGTPPGLVCTCNCAQFGSQPAESDQADFDAIQTVTANGYIVVNSSANGSVPMDDVYYGGIYDLNVRDSGALLIGAIDPGGNPTCWTNHGSRIDAHAWGSAVYSAGYGDLFFPGSDLRQSYSSSFGGTSAACPEVSGSVAALQGIYKSRNGGATLDAWQIRNLLRNTGTPQTGTFSKLVGNMPDLSELIAAIGGAGPDEVPPTIAHTPLVDTGSTSAYTVNATLSDLSGVASAALHLRLNGGSWSQTALTHGSGNSWSGTIPGQPVGSTIEYYITAVDGAGSPNTATSNTWTFHIISSTAGIVLLTPSNSTLSSGAAWVAALASAGYTGPVINVDDLSTVLLGTDTDALVVLLGVYSANFVMGANTPMALSIEAFINAGGRVYMEGGDCWAFDPGNTGGHDFNSLFGISGLADGTADLVTVTGHGVTSGTFSYTGANSWIDHLGSAGASLLFSNPTALYDCGYYQTGARTTACASFELAGLSGFQQVVNDLFGPALFNVLGDPPVLSLSPASVTGNAAPGGSDSEVLSLSNIGGGLLSWTATVSQNTLLSTQPVQPPLDLAKGESDPRPGILPNAAGGPDAFGYSWIDSDSPGGPALNFQDIAATGTALSMTDDLNLGPFNLGFTFSYYGVDYSSVHVCSNGFLSLSSTSTDYSNDPIPGTADPNALIAPFWDDLNPSTGGTVHYQAFADRFIVQWTAVRHYGNSDAYTFEVILHSNGAIEYQYGTLTGAVNSATVGIESADGLTGLQVVYNAAYLHSNLALRFSATPPPSPWLTLGNNSGSIPSGGSQTLSVQMNAAQLAEGVYTGTVSIVTNEPGTYNVPVIFVVGPQSLEAPVLDVSYLTPSQLRLSWLPVSGAGSYTIHSAPAWGGVWTPLATVPAGPFDVAVPAGATQLFRVTASN